MKCFIFNSQPPELPFSLLNSIVFGGIGWWHVSTCELSRPRKGVCTCARDIIRGPDGVSLLVSQNTLSTSRELRSGQGLLSLQRKRLKCHECLCRSCLGRDCDSNTALKDRACSAPSGWLFSVFDCLLDAESDSVIDSKSEGTGTQ